MSQKFQAEVHHRGGVCFLKLSGFLDEDNELGVLADQIHGRAVVVDLSDVERINSYGVRDWVNWLGRLEEGGRSAVLVECSPAVVAQINMVSNFTGGGVVKSFYVPYFCRECDEEKALLCETAEMGPPPYDPPTCRCDECDLVMDFDDMPEYFAFLDKHVAAASEAARAGGLERLSPAEAERSRVRSRVTQAPEDGNPSTLDSSLPSVPSLPSFSARREETVDTGPLQPDETESDPELDPISRARAAQGGSTPWAGAAAQILIGVLVLGLAALAYVLFAEP